MFHHSIQWLQGTVKLRIFVNSYKACHLLVKINRNFNATKMRFLFRQIQIFRNFHNMYASFSYKRTVLGFHDGALIKRNILNVSFTSSQREMWRPLCLWHKQSNAPGVTYILDACTHAHTHTHTQLFLSSASQFDPPARFEVCTAVQLVAIFSAVVPTMLAVVRQRFPVTCRRHIQCRTSILKMEAACYSETLFFNPEYVQWTIRFGFNELELRKRPINVHALRH
jgi:hypothetical protein